MAHPEQSNLEDESEDNVERFSVDRNFGGCLELGWGSEANLGHVTYETFKRNKGSY